jgi:hypothetical protein
MSTNDTDIVKLSINDTFYDWYLKTNQIIDYVNPINVYDVFAGSGLSESRTGTPGTVEFSVATDSSLYGIGTLANTQGIEEVVLNYNALSASSVSNSNVYSFQKAGDVIYKVQASNMLPPDINGDHAFAGIITVADLIVDDGTITLNNTGTNRDNCGLVIESVSETEPSNVFFTYDTNTLAWYSSEHLGVNQNKGFVTNSPTTAIFPFIASETQAQVDLRLQTTTSGIPERFSINAEFDATNTLTFSHYSNNALIGDILELTSSGTNGSSVIVKDTITITDVLNSTPFTNSPAITSIPVTDGTDGFLNQFVNRAVLVNNGASVGDFVYVNSSGQATRTDASSIAFTNQIGVVESVQGSDVVVVTSGYVDFFGGLVAGDIYYLDDVTPGGITNTNPSNTNGTISKPVLIATSNTSAILIPDFTNIGSGTTTVVGGGGIENSFATIVATGGVGTITASGESTLNITGGTNITLAVAGNTLTINSDIPESSTANQLLRRGASSYEWFTPSNYSVIVKPLNTGGIESVQLTPGTLLGRIDDATDENNPVTALGASDVLNLLGFSGNSFLKNVVFENYTGVPVYEYPDTNDGEILTIRAGDNITFDHNGSELIIHAGDISSTNTTGGEPTSLSVGIAGKQFSTGIDTLGFQSATNGVQFSANPQGASTVFITGGIGTDYLKLSTGSGTGSHIAGNTLRILGDSKTGTTTSYSTATGTETITVALTDTINVFKVAEKPDALAFKGLVLSGGSSTGASSLNRDSLVLYDESNATRDANTTSTAFNSKIAIKSWDLIKYPDEDRQTTYNGIEHDYCVSMYADTTKSDTNGVYTLPFRFYEIVVDKLKVNSLTVDTAAKTVEYLGTVIGFGFNPLYTRTSTVIVRNDMQNPDNPAGDKGMALRFYDDTFGAVTPNSYIYRPSADGVSAYSGRITEGTFIINGKISFGDILSTDAELTSPSISRGDTDTIAIQSLGNAACNLSLTTNGGGELLIGRNGTDAYFSFNNGANTYAFNLKADSNLDVTSFTIGTSTNGYKFNSTTFTNDATDKGKVLMVGSVTSGRATVESKYIIRPLVGADVASDPINTLYYVV